MAPEQEEALERLRDMSLECRGEAETGLSLAGAAEIIDSFLELLGYGSAPG